MSWGRNCYFFAIGKETNAWKDAARANPSDTAFGGLR